MAPDIQRNADDTITVSFTFKPGDSMLESELNLQAMSNEANALASGECLKRFDTDGARIAIGGRMLTSKGSEPKKYQTPYGPVSVIRHLYQSSFGGATYCPMEYGARVVRTKSLPLPGTLDFATTGGMAFAFLPSMVPPYAFQRPIRRSPSTLED